MRVRRWWRPKALESRIPAPNIAPGKHERLINCVVIVYAGVVFILPNVEGTAPVSELSDLMRRRGIDVKGTDEAPQATYVGRVEIVR